MLNLTEGKMARFMSNLTTLLAFDNGFSVSALRIRHEDFLDTKNTIYSWPE